MPIVDESVELSVLIHARAETVFRFFTDPERFARWWSAPGGGKATVEPRVGGAVRIEYQNGHVMSGEVVELVESSRFVMSWGYHEEDKGMPPGSTRVEFTLEPVAEGTMLRVRHLGLPTEESRAGHEAGWRHYLSVMAGECARDEFAGRLTSIVDGYFDAWREDDEDARAGALAAACAPDVRFIDMFACIDGVDTLAAHIGNARRHMPGATLRRTGEPMLCHNHAKAAWEIAAPDGSRMMSGENVFRLDASGRIELVVGFTQMG